MRNTRAILPLLLVLTPTMALAQAISGGTNLGNSSGGNQLVITGQAPQACVIAGSVQSSETNAVVNAGPTAAQVVVGQLVDANSVPMAATANLQLPVICNTANVLSISTANGALTLQGTAPPATGFRSQLPYTVSANWAGQAQIVNSGEPLQIASANAATGTVSIDIAIPAGGEPLLAGTYSDSIVVQLQPSN